MTVRNEVSDNDEKTQNRNAVNSLRQHNRLQTDAECSRKHRFYDGTTNPKETLTNV